jgi:hypothetical protein
MRICPTDRIIMHSSIQKTFLVLLLCIILDVYSGGQKNEKRVVWADTAHSDIQLLRDSSETSIVQITNRQYLYIGMETRSNRFPIVLKQEITNERHLPQVLNYSLHTSAYSLDSSSIGKKIWEMRSNAHFGEVYLTGLYHTVQKGCCDVKDLNCLYNAYSGKMVAEYTGEILSLGWCNEVLRMCGFKCHDTYKSHAFENERLFLGMVTFSTIDSITSQVAIFEEDTGQIERYGSQVVISSENSGTGCEEEKKDKPIARVALASIEKWKGKIVLKLRNKNVSINVAADTFNIPKLPVQRLIFKKIQ